MAQIDTSIPMGFRPIQIESPVNQMAALSQLQGLQQQQQMNALKMQEYQQQVQDKNELARIMGDPNLEYGSDNFMRQVLARAPSQYETIATRVAQREDIKERTAKREYETEKLKAETKQRQLEEFRNAQKDIAAFDSIEAIKDDIDRKVGAGLLPVDMAANILAGLPTDNANLPAWKKQTLMKLVTAEKQLELQDKSDSAAYADYLMDTVINNPDAKVMSEKEFISARGQPSAATGSEMTPAAAPAATSAVTTAPPEAGVTVSAENTPLAPGVAELLRSRDPRAKETAKILQARFENQIKSRQYTGDFANVQRARQDITNLRKQPQTPAIKEEIAGLERMIAGAEKGKGTTLTVGLSTEKKYGEKFAGGIADKDVALMDAAERAPEAANTANRILSLLQSGQVITGSAANIKLQMSKFLRLGGGSDSEAITNTEVLLSSLADSTLGAIKSSGLGSGQGFTDKDREFLERAKAGQITYEATSLKRLAELAHKAATATADKWNTRSKTIPKSAIEGTGISTEPVTVSPILKTGPRDKTPAKNSKGWTLHTDKDGNRAYVSPDGKQFDEVK